MSEHVYLMTIGLPLVTVLLVFAIRAVAAVLQARARLANEGAYRELAEKAAAAQSENAALLTALQAAVADIGARLVAVEKILKQVE